MFVMLLTIMIMLNVEVTTLRYFFEVMYAMICCRLLVTINHAVHVDVMMVGTTLHDGNMKQHVVPIVNQTYGMLVQLFRQVRYMYLRTIINVKMILLVMY